ncbi:ATP-binding cassette domain-containing protein [bacterium]|nr:ATP-binding cassette domain-containing protein [bacterium]
MNIKIQNCTENNLKNVSVEFEKGKFTVVTGVSGSGKSSLVYNTLFKESQRLYLSSFPAWHRKFFGVTKKPDVERISGLDACVAVDQRADVANSMSTVGTFSGIYDLLRVLFARHAGVSRSVFSFNSPLGACEACKGYGVEDFLDYELIIAEKTKSIRDRALKITAPNGYIIYSQVTLDVLDEVCRAHGFSVDTPLCDLTDEQMKVIFFGSEKIKVPFGKHTLESRMKWTGITAKPREEGYYKGIINVMAEILKRDRNPNILRFVRSVPCSKCHGSRLNEKVLKVLFAGKNIAELCEMTLAYLAGFLENAESEANEAENKIISEIKRLLLELINIGLGSLTLSMPSGDLKSSEVQRIRIAGAASSSLKGTTFVFDEPSIGLSRSELANVLNLLIKIRDNGNTVIAVEHDLDAIMMADNIVETGPGGGVNGGEILFSGSVEDFLKNADTLATPTALALKKFRSNAVEVHSGGKIVEGKLNAISGKTSFEKRSFIERYIKELEVKSISYEKIERSPIGRTSRSNPATYTGIFDKIRDLFASTDEAKKRGFSKSHFSFNGESGRCPKCEGGGVIETGMKFMGSVQTLCDKCNGKRFIDEVLEVKLNGLSVYDVLNLSISQALDFFKENKQISKTLDIMERLGIGYLLLGQPSSTLSGGEAQRIKLALWLSKTKENSVLIFEEPTAGLHPEDIERFVAILKEVTKSGVTVVAAENNPVFLRLADNVISFGNERFSAEKVAAKDGNYEAELSKEIVLKNVETHNLKNIDLHIKPNKFNVISGVSGSGKTSLAFDTLFVESIKAVMSGVSPYVKTFLLGKNQSSAAKCEGLRAGVGVSAKFSYSGVRSTVGTVSGIYEFVRMLFSRAGKFENGEQCNFSAGDFSFNSEKGACEKCSGTGFILGCDIKKLCINPELSFADGALAATKQGRFYADKDGQFIHTLYAAGEKFGIDFSKPVKELSPREFDIAMFGAGDEIFDINWEYKRGNVTGTHSFKGKWTGFANLITDEYYRSSGNKNEEELFSLMGETVCPECQGKRLKKELLAVKFAGMSIDEFCEKPITEIKKFLDSFVTQDEREREIFLKVKAEISGKISKIILLGLGHLTLARAASTLSTGERARLRLIKSSADDLQNLIYVVDEPSRGLHPFECENMAKLLKETAANGNTVVAVEHVPEIIKNADHIIEMGPGSGDNGGKIVFEGDYNSLIKSDCYTAKALNFKPVLKENNFSDFITLSNISENNLKNITVSIPLGKTTVISGVSGSGKTTLIKCLSENIHDYPIFFDRFGLDNLTGGTSNIASFSGCFDKIKKKFGKSFKITKNDICKTCKGTGKNSVSMDFLGNIENFCADCNGTGFAENILSFKFKDKNIAEILDMEIGTAAEFFSDDPAIFKVLDILGKCGLHYLKLSQQVSTLSSGELMRLNFAVSFASFNAEKSRNGIFIFDEPSSGLHFCDVEKLLEMFKTLNDSGNTVIIAEHRSQIIASADYVIDLGPGSGENGGNVVFQGEVRDLVNCAESVTGRMIKLLV